MRSPSSPPPSPAGEPTLLPPGAEVEVRVDADGFYGTWFEATVVGMTPVPGRGSADPAWYTVAYADDLSAIGGGVLPETFAPTHVRPRPPVPESPPPRFLLHDIVEAFDTRGWWPGVVVSAEDAASVTVAFPITREEIPFPPRLVRRRRDYAGGEWTPSRSVIAVPPKRPVRVYEAGEDVEVGRDREEYGYSWFPATVAKVIDGLSYVVEYIDLEEKGAGGAGKAMEYLHWRFIRPAVEHLPRQSEFRLGPGVAVEVCCDGAWSAGVVHSILGDDEFEVSINGKQEGQLITEAVEFLKPQYRWDGRDWRIGSANKRQASFRPPFASGKRQRSYDEVLFSDDENNHDLEYCGVKSSKKELLQKVAVLAEGSKHDSVAKMDTRLSVLENSPGSIHPLNSCSPVYGHPTAPKNYVSHNVQNLLERKIKLPSKVYTSKKMSSKKKEGLEGPHSLHTSEQPCMGQQIGVNEIAWPQRESSLMLARTESPQQQLDRTLKDTVNANQVTYQEPVALLLPLGFKSVSNDADIHSSSFNKRLTAPKNGCEENRNADVLKENTGTQLPFIKRSDLWSKFDEMDVFKNFPQRPHFFPLQQYSLGLREGKALGLMSSFDLFVQSIRKLSIADKEGSFEEKQHVLAELKTCGFDVQYFESMLDKLIKVKSEYTKHLEEKSEVEAQKRRITSSLSRNDSLLCQLDKAMSELELKLGHLRQKGQLIAKEKEQDEQNLSRLNVVENSIMNALDVNKHQFGSILAGKLQNRLT